MPIVSFGVDNLIASVPPDLRSGRIGMITSNVATTAMTGALSRVALKDAGVRLTKLFGPEHGLAASAADGEHVADDRDAATGLPVVSLYGSSVRPSPESLSGIDALIYDLPDVGARFYTYIWTLSHAMEAAADARLPLYLLDRPNPLGGDLDAVEGPMLDETHLSSFVGRWNMPVRYSLTLGELATLWNAERSIGCDLRVIPLTGWKRDMLWPDVGVRFIAPSPNLLSYEAAVMYPGTCLIEGTTLSEGRGTDRPFQLIGAPYVDADALATAMNAKHLPGVRISPAHFTPASRKHANELCHGVFLEAIDCRSIRPVSMGLHLIAELIRLHPQQFEWLPIAEVNGKPTLQHFDRLIGQSGVRAWLMDEPTDLDDRIATATEAASWKLRARSHLLYA